MSNYKKTVSPQGGTNFTRVREEVAPEVAPSPAKKKRASRKKTTPTEDK
jgi:hypothetical protein